MGQAGGYAYTASKGGLVTIVKALAVELARYGIRANALLPGWTEAGITTDAFANPTFVRNVMPRMPVRRWGTGEDYAGIAVYLASSASSFHTGDSILIDGGYAAF
jgi:NAD(P)-dependent dehydrogenase (short-subunit alcohol dehydrogenase family)